MIRDEVVNPSVFCLIQNEPFLGFQKLKVELYRFTMVFPHPLVQLLEGPTPNLHAEGLQRVHLAVQVGHAGKSTWMKCFVLFRETSRRRCFSKMLPLRQTCRDGCCRSWDAWYAFRSRHGTFQHVGELRATVEHNILEP